MVELLINNGGANGFETLELYGDEKISITQNVNNFRDISKVFADYSQTFTVPCSPHNNAILKHWYDVVIVDSFDARYKYPAVIKINGNYFNTGDIQLMNVKVVDGKPESYSVTFFGKVKQIKDILGDLKLSDLDYSSLSLTYPTDVYNRITSSTLQDVMFPLLANDRRYTYGDASGTDVTTVTGGIARTSLFPSVRVQKILDLISSQLGLTLNDNFATSGVFDKLYLLFKNANTMTVSTGRTKINFTAKSSTNYLGLDLATDKIECGLFSDWKDSGGVTRNGRLSGLVLVVTPVTSTPYRVVAFKNGVQVFVSNDLVGTQPVNLSSLRTLTGAGSNTDTLELYVESNAPISFTTLLSASYNNSYWNGFNFITVNGDFTATSPSQSTIGDLVVTRYAPDMKIYDFIMGLVKCFNLVVTPTGANEFNLTPMDDWFEDGNEIDLTTSLITDLQIEQPPLYKKLSFKHADSSSVTNYGFDQSFARLYGNVDYTTNFDTTTSDYTLESPFEDILYERLTGSNFQTATFVDKTGNTYYTPKPLLMFCNGLQTLGTAIKLKDESGGSVNVTSYNRFSNDITDAGANRIALNFSNEYSSFDSSTIPLGLFDTYYGELIGGLYNIDCRIVKCKFKLSLVDVLRLKMNDRIKLKNIVYTINNITTDVTSLEVDAELISNFRNIGVLPAPVISASDTGLDVPIRSYSFDSFDVGAGTGFLSGAVTPSTGNTGGIVLTLTPPENTGTQPRTGVIPITYYLDGVPYPKALMITQNSYFPSGKFAENQNPVVDNTAQTLSNVAYIGLNAKVSVLDTGLPAWVSLTPVIDSQTNVSFNVILLANSSGVDRGASIFLSYTSPLGTVYTRPIGITQNA